VDAGCETQASGEARNEGDHTTLRPAAPRFQEAAVTPTPSVRWTSSHARRRLATMNRFRELFRLPSQARRPAPEPAPEATAATTETPPPEAKPASIAANERLQNRPRPADDSDERQEPQPDR
jgi:hypothetical protein